MATLMAPALAFFSTRYPMRIVLSACDEPAWLMSTRIWQSTSSSNRSVQHLRPIFFKSREMFDCRLNISAFDDLSLTQWVPGCHVTRSTWLKSFFRNKITPVYFAKLSVTSACHLNEEYIHSLFLYRYRVNVIGQFTVLPLATPLPQQWTQNALTLFVILKFCQLQTSIIFIVWTCLLARSDAVSGSYLWTV